MEPIRTCIGCRRRAAQSELLRLVRRGDEIVDGTRPRLPGRGAYLHEECFGAAQKRLAFRRAFGPGAVISDELRHQLAAAAAVALPQVKMPRE
ncbi:MAG: YlxR family protein [Propionibacteriaceae bacterium]|nr:YlxR family protein [Propionibacteriaceae bacterium]